MMRHWSVYRLSDGLLTGQQFGSSVQGHEKLNVPDSCALIEGRHDHRSKRVDLNSKAIVEYTPPPPTEEEKVKARRSQVLGEILTLESLQHRAMREAVLGDVQAMERLKEIDSRIAALRATL